MSNSMKYSLMFPTRVRTRLQNDRQRARCTLIAAWTLQCELSLGPSQVSSIRAVKIDWVLPQVRGTITEDFALPEHFGAQI